MMWRRRLRAGSAGRSGRGASHTISRGWCPVRPRSRPRLLPSAYSSMSKMTSGVASAPLAQVDASLLAVALGQGSALPTSLADLDRAAGGVVARVITSGDFKGKRDETTLLYPTGAKP